MTCEPGHRGPAGVHTHQPAIVRDRHGQPVGRRCACGAAFDVRGRPVGRLGGRSKLRDRVLDRLRVARDEAKG